MSPSLQEPATLVVLCLVAGFIIGLHLTLFGLLRGDSRVRQEAAKWTAAVSGGRTGRAATFTIAERARTICPRLGVGARGMRIVSERTERGGSVSRGGRAPSACSCTPLTTACS